ncbi:hypothetical protein SLEP1_g56673 [Rubroshorea leprosula]|uniref:RRM domain-containing protein n=1 Tax=Rubroshorea leprosula TaxID=152421 RepID=A0AAV5MKB2_9ROSI|nr:hypothetical protein SLEP1_g56673 [Rubroshorea leprosula]
MVSTRVSARGDTTWGSGSFQRWQGYNQRIVEYGNWRKGQVEPFFFYNFSKSWDVKALWHRFQECGKVVDMFVPRKRDNWGKHFGLVRMEGVQDVKQVEERLNRIWLGSYKLRVKIVTDRGQQRMGTQRNAGMKVNIREQRFVQPGKSYVQAVMGYSSRAGAAQAQNKKVGGQPRVEAVDRVSINQVMPATLGVRGSDDKMGGVMVENNGEEIIEFFPLHEETQWLEGSMAVVVRSMLVISTIQERIDVNGGLIKISPLGGQSLLLTECLKGYLSEYLQQNKVLFDLWCEAIYPWALAPQHGARMVWIRISGVPLKSWCDRCFEKIASSVGEVLKVEEEMYEIRLSEEEWRADSNWWLDDEDRQGASTTESKYSSSVNGEEDHELHYVEIHGVDEDAIDEEQLHEEGSLNLNQEVVQAGKEVVREEENGLDRPGIEMGLFEVSKEGLEAEFGLLPCVSGSAMDSIEKRRKDLKDCYPQEQVANCKDGTQWVTSGTMLRTHQKLQQVVAMLAKRIGSSSRRMGA